MLPFVWFSVSKIQPSAICDLPSAISPFSGFNPSPVVPYWPAMPKRRHILILLACGLAAGLDALLSAPREPAYQGRFLTEWLENHRGDLTNSPSDRT